jgi:hypothetical protein
MCALPLRLYVDLSKQDYWHRLEWERTLAGGRSDVVHLVASEDQAECVLETGTAYHYGPGGLQ